eukprot:sb/3472378/
MDDLDCILRLSSFPGIRRFTSRSFHLSPPSERMLQWNSTASPGSSPSDLLILPVSPQEHRVPCKSCNYAKDWILGETATEVIKTSVGLKTNGEPSRLSKKSLFKKFNEVCAVVTKSTPYQEQYYNAVKADAEVYQLRKKRVFDGLAEAGYGSWVGKPIEQDLFYVRQ